MDVCNACQLFFKPGIPLTVCCIFLLGFVLVHFVVACISGDDVLYLCFVFAIYVVVVLIRTPINP